MRQQKTALHAHLVLELVPLTSRTPAIVGKPQATIDAAFRGDGSSWFIAVTEPVTVDSSPNLRRQLLECLREPKCEGIVIDLSRVVYVDTSALAILLEVFKAAKMLNKKFALRGLQDRPRYLFETARLLRLFEEADLHTPESESRN